MANSIISLKTIDELRDLNKNSNYEFSVVLVTDKTEGGVFVYDTTRFSEDDGVDVIAGWVRSDGFGQEGGQLAGLQSTAAEIDAVVKGGTGSSNILNYAYADFYGAKGDGTTDDTAAIQTACNNGICILSANKKYRVTSTITAPYGIVGQGFGTEPTSGKSSAIFVNIADKANFSATVPVLDVSGVQFLQLKNFRIFAPDLRGTADEMLLIKGHKVDLSAGVRRFDIDEVYLYGGSGMTFDGWLGYHFGVYVYGAKRGLKLYRFNGMGGCNVTLEECSQYLDFYNDITTEGSASIHFSNLTLEGIGANCNTIPSRVSNFHSLTIDSFYNEGIQRGANTIVFGDNTLTAGTNFCQNLTIKSYSNAPYAGSTTTETLVFDNVQGLIINGKESSSSDYGTKVSTTVNTTNPVVSVNQIWGAQAKQNLSGEHYNMLGNSDFRGGYMFTPRFSALTNATMTLDTTLAFGDSSQSLKIQAAAAGVARSRFLLPTTTNAFKKLLGKPIQLAAWVYIPATYPYNATTCYPSISLGLYSPTGNLFPEFAPSKIATGKWVLYKTPLTTFKADSTSYIEINLLANGKSGGDATAYINVGKVYLTSGDQSFLIVNNDLMESPNADIRVEATRVVYPAAITPDTATQTYVQAGDRLYNTAPTAGQYMGKIATAAAQAYASWSNFGLLV